MGWLAAGDDGDVGWLVLRGSGYHAQADARLVDELPKQWSGLRRLAEVLEQDGGGEWWEQHGAILDVEFDLIQEHGARRRLRAYLDARLATGRLLPTQLGSHPVAD